MELKWQPIYFYSTVTSLCNLGTSMTHLHTSLSPKPEFGLTLQQTREAWANLGIVLQCNPAPIFYPPARLILESIRYIPEETRLFFLVSTWINKYCDLVNAGEMACLFRSILTERELPVLALLLETGLPEYARGRFQNIIHSIQPAATPQPLFTAMSCDSYRHEYALNHSSEVGKRWNLWVEEVCFSTHMNAIRPLDWILRRNPELGFIALLHA